MGAVLQLNLTDDLASAIHRLVSEGHAASESAFLTEAARRFAEHLDAESALRSIAQAGIADAEAGRYTVIETEADADALFERTMAEVRRNIVAAT